MSLGFRVLSFGLGYGVYGFRDVRTKATSGFQDRRC